VVCAAARPDYSSTSLSVKLHISRSGPCTQRWRRIVLIRAVSSLLLAAQELTSGSALMRYLNIVLSQRLEYSSLVRAMRRLRQQR
jgi:hypothetical protein